MRVVVDVRSGTTTVDPSWVDPAPQAGPPVPASVTARQLRLWLVRHGIPLSAVDTALAALPAPSRTEAQIEWDYATVFERTNPLLRQVAAAVLGLEGAALDQALDAGFIEAAAI